MTVGSGLASACNFFSFVILPALVGTQGLNIFVRDNYLGGLYLAIIGSSIAPFSLFVFTSGRRVALTRYILICLLIILLLLLFGMNFARWPNSYFCLLAAICMHLAGFFLASLIKNERVLIASFLQIVQPLAFALLISVLEFLNAKVYNWAFSYFISALFCLSCFLFASNTSEIRNDILAEPSDTGGWKEMIGRIGMAVSFPLFFQLEIILCAEFSTVDVGLFVVLQKLYSSISTSLFSSLGILMITRSIKKSSEEVLFIDTRLILMGGASALCVIVLGYFIDIVGKGLAISIPILVSVGFVAFLFTICSYISLKLTIFKPFVGLFACFIALSVYSICFFVIRPGTVQQLLFASIIFFVTFLIILLAINYKVKTIDK